ncbi:unnamed protein product [Effrenium voratum]|nr:unnamed protein product [Effrenium voratum]
MSTLLQRLPNLCRAEALPGKVADARLKRALEEIEVCEPKLDDSEARLAEMLHSGVHKVRFALPRLDAEAFREVLASVGHLKEDVYLQLRQARTSSIVSLEEGNDAFRHVELDPQEDIWSICLSLRLIGLAALVSLLVVLLLSISPVQLEVASLIGGIFGLLLQFVAFAQSWSHQVSWMFGAFNGAASRIISTLDEPMSCYGERLAKPLETLEAEVDVLEQEQAIVIKRMQELESAVKEAIPDFEAPSAEVLREPIAMCQTRISGFVEESKAVLPEQLEEQLRRHPTGRLVVQRSSFDWWLVHLPLLFVLLMNLGLLAMSQALVHSSLQQREMDDVDWRNEDDLVKDFKARFPTMSFSVSDEAQAPAPPQEPWLPRAALMWMPALAQAMATALQLMAGLYLSRASRLLAAVSGVTADLDKTCNLWLEKQSRGMAAEVFSTFGQVQKHAERFFPTFRLRLGQLRSYLLAGAKAGADCLTDDVACMTKCIHERFKVLQESKGWFLEDRLWSAPGSVGQTL